MKRKIILIVVVVGFLAYFYSQLMIIQNKFNASMESDITMLQSELAQSGMNEIQIKTFQKTFIRFKKNMSSYVESATAKSGYAFFILGVIILGVQLDQKRLKA